MEETGRSSRVTATGSDSRTTLDTPTRIQPAKLTGVAGLMRGLAGVDSFPVIASTSSKLQRQLLITYRLE
ncbi:hypothetical protein RRG08_061072 [Elysia crispata]|uniref:Uncharacterized protein n=1 Tax=Elysia crispata TaxID=231223 RepID=A0AAE0YW84_9GAST|nr:hypothetical protein RRG08_061072 [Elysia crispata]